MPKRPRQHQLEDESRTAFRTALLAEWVFRDSVPDYGIDGEVEIFDIKGLATGRRFHVQLKATDKLDLDRALAISLRIDTCSYYRSLDLPVLIVRYHAPTRKLYTKWFHSFDPYYGKKAKKSITFRLTPEDEWDQGTAARLTADLETIRKINSPQLALPVRSDVNSGHESLMQHAAFHRTVVQRQLETESLTWPAAFACYRISQCTL